MVAAGGLLRRPLFPGVPCMNVPKRVLFVCVENANRSQMAEAFARILGGDAVEAFSAGSRPSGVVNPKAISAMAELGYDLTAHGSKSLADLPDEEFDLVATMGCGDSCPHVRAKQRLDWTIPDPKHMPPDEFRGIRDLIRDKVHAALADLGLDGLRTSRRP
jgi:protein-tyrosine-phosphatase